MRHILGNKVLEYDVDNRGVIVDEREDVPVEVYAENFYDSNKLSETLNSEVWTEMN